MSQGWNPNCQSHAPLSCDSLTLEIPLESREIFADPSQRLSDKGETSSMMISQEKSACNRITPGTLQPPCYESKWQGAIKQFLSVGEQTRETVIPDGLGLLSGSCPVLDTDTNPPCQGPSSALSIPFNHEDYSDVSSSSENETRSGSTFSYAKVVSPPNQPVECQGFEGSEELNTSEVICPPSSFVRSSLEPDGEEITSKQASEGIQFSETFSEKGGGQRGSGNDTESSEVWSTVDKKDQYLNSSSCTDAEINLGLQKRNGNEIDDIFKNCDSSLEVEKFDCENPTTCTNSYAFQMNDGVRNVVRDLSDSCEAVSEKTSLPCANDSARSLLEGDIQALESRPKSPETSTRPDFVETLGMESTSEMVSCKDAPTNILTSSNRDIEFSSFDFLESCFHFRNTTHGIKMNHVEGKPDSNEESDISHCEEGKIHPLENTEPLLFKVGSETIQIGQEKRAVVEEEPPPLTVCFAKPQTSSENEMHNDQMKSFVSSKEQSGHLMDSTPENGDGASGKVVAPLISFQKLKKKLLPVVVISGSEQKRNEVIFHCASCQETAQSANQLIEHHHCTHANHHFQHCLTCGCYFTSDTFARQHVCVHNRINKCSSSTHLLTNCPLKTANAKYKCQYCDKPFVKRIGCEEHELRHRAITPYRCSHCGLGFAQSCTLKRHQRKVQCLPLKRAPHEQADVSNQEGCNLSGKSRPTPESVLKLPDCFVKLVDCKRNQHSQPVVCQVCGRSFKLRAQLNTHLRSHTDERPFKCQSCSKAFKYPWNLNRHEREQCTGSDSAQEALGGDRKTAEIFKCPICSRMFKHSYLRLRHLRQQCLKEYTRKGMGKVGNRYKCPLCSYTFSMSCNRNRHIRRLCFDQYKKGLLKMKKTPLEGVKQEKHQGNPPSVTRSSQNISKHKCKICPAVFAHKSGMYRHRKKHALLEMSGEPVVHKHTSPTALKNASPMAKRPTEQTSSIGNLSPSFSCRFCGRSFNALYSLRKHTRLHKGDKPFRCLDCGKCFARHGHLVAHKNVHQRRIQCTVCKKILPTITDLLHHRQSHIKRGMLQCPVCPRQFKFPVFLLRHVATHENKVKRTISPPRQQKQPVREEKPEILKVEFMCAVCQKVFNDAEAMHNHCLNHLPNPSSSKCQFCKRAFHSRAALVRHIRVHTGEKPFPCQDCGERFYRPEGLKTHQAKCAGSQVEIPSQESVTRQTLDKYNGTVLVEVKQPFKCTYCPNAFAWASSLKKHESGHILNEVFPCSQCGKCYHKKKLQEHKSKCTGKGSTRVIRYACRCCGGTFSRQDNRNVHEKKCKSSASVLAMRIPEISGKIQGQRGKDTWQHKCPHCFKYFRYRCYLLRHLPFHSREKPHTCIHCGQKYANQRRYLQHEAFCDGVYRKQAGNLSESLRSDSKLIHSSNTKKGAKSEKEGEFKCKFCTKGFTRARYLRRHILTHTEVKPYRCKACESCFSRYDHLKLHEKHCRGKRQRLEVRIEKIRLEDIGTGCSTKSQKPGEVMMRCSICSKQFTSKANLARHISMLHTMIKPFSCKRCNNVFTSKKSLRRHSVFVKCKKSLKEAKKSAKASSSNQPCRETSKLLQRIQGYYSNKLKFQCSYCPRRFENRGQLNVHTRLHTGEKPFGCADCGERFIRRDYLQRHLVKCNFKMETRDKVLCDRCGDMYTPEALRSHQMHCVIRSNSTVFPQKVTNKSSPPKIKGFSCTNCSERFLLFSQLQQHFLTEHRVDGLQKPDEALSCPQEVTSAMHIKEEPLDEGFGSMQPSINQVHSKENSLNTGSEVKRPFVCPHCNMQFVNNSGLGMHMRKHSAAFVLFCKKCHRGFNSKTTLRKHHATCHGPLLLTKKDSEESSNLPGSDSALNDTVLVFDRGSQTTGTGVLQTNFSCKDHDKETVSDKVETVVHKYQCSECDQSFTDGLRLISHLEDHGREEEERRLGGRHRCHLCLKFFGQIGNLQRHVKIQHGKTMANICPECFKGFRCPSDLDVHRSCHDPNRPFVCSICKLRFWTVKALSVHKRQHSIPTSQNESSPEADRSPKEYSCQHCNKIYTLKKSYMRHCRVKHKRASDPTETDPDNINPQSDEEEGDVGSEDDDSDSAPYFPCHVCGKTFQTSESLEDHQRCHLGEKPYECAECGKCFVQLVNLQQHERSHKSEFQCQTCGRGFVSLFALRKHKHSHGKNRPHRCTKCHLSFTGPSQLAEHMATHRDENFPCDLCDCTFSCKISRAEHRKIHTDPVDELPPLIPPTERATSSLTKTSSTLSLSEQYKYRCGICHERFRDPEQLSEHGCNAAKERPYSCPECNKHFLHGSHLKKHQLDHQLSGPQTYQCNLCHLSFSYRHHFLNHFKTHGNDEGSDHNQALGGAEVIQSESMDQERIYQCPICPHSFSQAMELANHLSIHSYTCIVCNMTFPSRKQLTEHEKCHLTAATQYECTECGESFLGSNAFRQHQCSHRRPSLSDKKHLSKSSSPPPLKKKCSNTSTEEKNNEEEEVDVGEDFYNCLVCEKRFSTTISLQEHQKQHTEERPHKCSVCRKGFAKKRYLAQHQLIHVEPPYRCGQCKMSFRNESSLLSHQKMHNKNRPHKCSVCNKCYVTAYDLTRHKRRHVEHLNTSKKHDHRCDMCYKSFSQLSELREHQESHVGQVVYECTECDKAFAFFHLLEEHQRSHEGHTESL